MRSFLFLARLVATVLAIGLLSLLRPSEGRAQEGLQPLLQEYQAEIAKPSRSTVDRVLAALMAADRPGTAEFLLRWQDRGVYERPDDGLFFYAEEAGGALRLIDIDSGAAVAEVSSRDVNQIRPNSGVRGVIAAALVPFELNAPDPARRAAALDAIARSGDASQIDPLSKSIETETDPALKQRKERLLTLLTAQFASALPYRLAAIEGLAGDISIEARSVLNQLTVRAQGVGTALPTDANIARVLEVATDVSEVEAYDRLVAANLAPPRQSATDRRDVLAQHIVDGAVGGVPLHLLNTDDARARAYEALEAAGNVPPRAADDEVARAVAAHVFYEVYAEPNPEVTAAAEAALASTSRALGLFQTFDLVLDGLSLASIFFLAAIGLAITFGVMGVINMAHGEFIMMGAYTGYVVQLFIPDYTVSLIIALPLAFVVTFGAGVVMERLVIRHLYTRPLETLLATFGISIALQQLAKNIFGTQARPLTAPDWLSGALTLNDIVSISNIRVAIFVLALMFLALLLFILKRTRLGLEVRAVTQNPGMAASMGIDPDRINMLTFGLGSGIAGIAGVAIGLYAQVTSEMGANYIVQSFMTVVVGGVGNVWGTLAGASMIGFLQKGIEWFNPSNTLAAQTYMVLFVILFIQFRPKGIVALKGRAAGD
ncbi:Branched-chain amino acid ABC transporter, permease protein [Roseovarius sp. EC-HK134]|uniref:urea ABC transporter permease subunit UrtB n=1 Tax=unclassified Roseovarius TaxID=2614913 RepID=UPI001256CC65|nr:MULTISPECIES: urea ABC transporter permease subunit UrtB [unclassified Roseovarius]VVT03820.1 Branched-chain amino acid ABC transporter, permease protein [Roseovarius sp. EC-HK134]VVT04230.1 Branched-chain amino acid ABC transporter, permease protein [Roseovarius sp. EC-SD190]